MSAASPQSRQAGHETSRVPLGPVVWVTVAFVAMAVLVLLGTFGFMKLLAGGERGFGQAYGAPLTTARPYPAPALQVNPQVDLQTYRKNADRELQREGHVDGPGGPIFLPIERAIDLLAARGLPVRPPVQDGGTELDMQNRKAADDRDRALSQPPERRRP